MYSQKVISENLSKIQPSVTYINSKGQEEVVYFELQETSPSDCEQAVDFFNDKIDFDLYQKTVDKGSGKTKIEFKNNWTPDLSHLIFIENERIMSKYSWNYWSERYYKISDKRNQFIQYHANRAQKIWDRIDSRLQENGLPVKRGNWKARQQTSTTHSQGKLQHRIQFYSDVKGVTASLDKSTTAIMAQMITDSMARQPFWLRPKIANMVSDDFYYYDNGSLLNLGTGTGKQISTGTTPTVAHLSEVPYYLYPNESIIQSLLPAMHDSEVTFLVLEGTANGRGEGNFWWELWQECTRGLKDGSYEVYPIFVPNCARDDTYPTDAWMRQRAAIFANWKPSQDTIIYANKVRSYIVNNPDLRDEFGSNWYLSREKMFWYETEYKKHKEKGTLHIFLQEFPATPDEMFQNHGGGVYSIELINRYENAAYKVIPEVYMLRGQESDIPYDLQPQFDEIDSSKPRIELTSNWLGDTSGSTFELVPVHFEGWDRFRPKNKILIFEHPNHEFEYGVSVDTSDGLGEKISDDSAIQIIRKGTVESNDRQVCEFTSPEIPQLQLWPFVMALSTYFSYREQCLLTIEINKGEELQNIMMRRGWWNLFLRKDDTVVSQNANSTRRFGFYTSPRSREALMSHIHSFIRGQWIDIYSLKLIDELKDLKKIRLLSRVKEAGAKDNRFIALGMGLYALHRDDDREKPIWEKRAQQNSSRIILPTAPNYNKLYSAAYDVYEQDNLSSEGIGVDEFIENVENSWNDYWR